MIASTRPTCSSHLRPLRERLGLDEHQFLALGRVRPENPHEEFCMSVLAIKLAARTNAVSSLHGTVSRFMWRGLWPERRGQRRPDRPHHQRRPRRYLALLRAQSNVRGIPR